MIITEVDRDTLVNLKFSIRESYERRRQEKSERTRHTDTAMSEPP